MKAQRIFDVIIIGGSYSGLAAGMALGRSLKTVLIIDSGNPCNKQTPHSHNFLTQDGETPKEIAAVARQQVKKYDTVTFLKGLATTAAKTKTGFDIAVQSGEIFSGRKVIFATGITDIMPTIKGYAECWGISVLHCPYCHGYEVKDERTGILGNGEYGYEFSALISNWTNDLTLYTNGKSMLTKEQTLKLSQKNIRIIEGDIAKLEHKNGYLENIVFKSGEKAKMKTLYARNAFSQHSAIPGSLGCELTSDGYINVDQINKTTVPGIFACGDNTTRMRTVANAVAMGTNTGMAVNKELIMEDF